GDAVRAVRRRGEDQLELLRLAVGQPEDRREVGVDAPGQLAAGCRRGRRLQDLHVAQDDSADDCVLRLREGSDEVDVVARLQGAGEKLVRISLDLVGTHRALQLSLDSRLGDRAEARGRHLLACESLLRGDLVLDLVRARYRAWNDTV